MDATIITPEMIELVVKGFPNFFGFSVLSFVLFRIVVFVLEMLKIVLLVVLRARFGDDLIEAALYDSETA